MSVGDDDVVVWREAFRRGWWWRAVETALTMKGSGVSFSSGSGWKWLTVLRQRLSALRFVGVVYRKWGICRDAVIVLNMAFCTGVRGTWRLPVDEDELPTTDTGAAEPEPDVVG